MELLTKSTDTASNTDIDCRHNVMDPALVSFFSCFTHFNSATVTSFVIIASHCLLSDAVFRTVTTRRPNSNWVQVLSSLASTFQVQPWGFLYLHADYVSQPCNCDSSQIRFNVRHICTLWYFLVKDGLPSIVAGITDSSLAFWQINESV